ncbi:MAG: type II secretion system F family protein [bacterium]|nr:type II secretion system F family protein [bacterium]
MATFAYRGLQGQERRDGEIDAADRRAALQGIRRMGIVPLRVVAAEGGQRPARAQGAQAKGPGLSLSQGIKGKQITALTRQLGTLTNAGFPLARALAFVGRQADKPQLRELIASIDSEVRGGATLSDALSRHPRQFNSLYVNMIQAGEAGGILALLLDRLAGMREADEALVAKIKGAMTYPAIMLLAMLGSLVILFTFVVPKFALMFEEMGQSLPMPTQVMMSISGLFANYWWALLGGIAALVAGPILWGKTQAGRRALDRFKLRIPVFGTFATQIAMARLCRTLGTLLDSGVNLIAALEASRGVAGNLIIAQAVTDSLKDIREGKKVGQTFAATGLFPDLVTEMITLGEESGQVGNMMLKVAEVYERQTDELVKALTSILEPVMILFMGGIVGMVVVAMLMPIFSMNLMG